MLKMYFYQLLWKKHEVFFSSLFLSISLGLDISASPGSLSWSVFSFPCSHFLIGNRTPPWTLDFNQQCVQYKRRAVRDVSFSSIPRLVHLVLNYNIVSKLFHWILIWSFEIVDCTKLVFNEPFFRTNYSPLLWTRKNFFSVSFNFSDFLHWGLSR